MNIRHFVLPILILFSVLTLQGCKDKDKGASEEISKVQATFSSKVTADNLKTKDFDSFHKVKSRQVDDTEAERALKKLGLGKDGIFAWEKKSGSNGNYVFTGLSVIETDDGELNMARLELDGVHMKDDTPRFDRLTVSGLATSDEKEAFAVGEAVLVRPSLEAAEAIYEIVERLRSFKDIDDIDFEGDGFGFEAVRLRDMKAQSEDSVIEVAAFDWGADPETEQGGVRLEGVSLKNRGGDDVIITFGYLGVTDLDLKTLRKLDTADKTTNLSPHSFGAGTQFFKTLSLSDFALAAGGLNVKADAIKVKTEDKGGNTHSIYTMSPVTVDFTGADGKKANRDVHKILSGLGYDRLTIRGGGESIYNPKSGTLSLRDSFLELTDGFHLSYDYVFGGVDDSAADPTETMTLNSLEFRLKDNSLLDRVITHVATEQKSTESLVRMQAKGALMIASIAVEDPGQKQIVAQAAEALTQFIDDGGTLQISMKPATPIRVSELQNRRSQDFDPAALGLSITVE